MNIIDLKGRNAIITGAANGIGKASAERLSRCGATVALWDLPSESLENTKKLLKENCFTVEADITSEEQVSKGVKYSLDKLKSIDILVNCAGVAGENATVQNTNLSEWKRVIDINLNGTFIMCKSVIAAMIDAKYGRIVNIASVAGKEGNPNASHYSASKAGVIAFTRSLGKELAKTGILVICITPAVIETKMLSQVTDAHKEYMVSRIPLGRMGQPEEVAAMVCWLSSDECSFSTAAAFDLSGGRSTY